MLPLKGITVVWLGPAVAGPSTTRQRADLGARVIKIERPQVGDFARRYDKTVLGQSSHFVWLNRSKESLTLDVKHPEAAAILDRLVKKADVFVQNLVPGAAADWGFPPAIAGQEPHRRLQYSGYGPDGPYSLKSLRSADPVRVGRRQTGTPETSAKSARSPTSPRNVRLHRHPYRFFSEKTGQGRRSMPHVRGAGEWMYLLTAGYGGSAPPRTGAAHAPFILTDRFRRRRQDRVFGIQNEREWASFARSR